MATTQCRCDFVEDTAEHQLVLIQKCRLVELLFCLETAKETVEF